MLRRKECSFQVVRILPFIFACQWPFHSTEALDLTGLKVGKKSLLGQQTMIPGEPGRNCSVFRRGSGRIQSTE
ncbi:hypothetical protein R1flu_024863 [Riccia fluitans]|uniref:Secreted protein n=1 Tax=Riccia fluitans TaxID=41844 RepID=A0ABD1XZ40_9MARC